MSTANRENRSTDGSRPFLDEAAHWLRQRKALKRLVVGSRELSDHVVDRWLGIRTCSPEEAYRHPGSRFGDGNRYVPNSYLFLGSLIRPLQISPEDVVVDIGCGMGRTLCVLARLNVR